MLYIVTNVTMSHSHHSHQCHTSLWLILNINFQYSLLFFVSICRWLKSYLVPLDSDINTLSMLFSAGVTGSFTDCIFLLCLKDIHNELHLPSPLPLCLCPPIHAHVHFFYSLSSRTVLLYRLDFWLLLDFFSLLCIHAELFFFGFPGTVIAWEHSSPLGIESFTHHASFLSCWSSLSVTFISAWFCSAAIWLSIIIFISSLLFTKCRNKISFF